MDFTDIIAAVSAGTIVAAILSMGAVKILPNVAKWGTNKVVGFFR